MPLYGYKHSAEKARRFSALVVGKHSGAIVYATTRPGAKRAAMTWARLVGARKVIVVGRGPTKRSSYEKLLKQLPSRRKRASRRTA